MIIEGATPPVVGAVLSRYLQILNWKAATAQGSPAPAQGLHMWLRLLMLGTMQTVLSSVWSLIREQELMVSVYLIS